MVIEKTGKIVINKFYYEHELKRSEKELEVRKHLHGKELSNRMNLHNREWEASNITTLLLLYLFYLAIIYPVCLPLFVLLVVYKWKSRT